MTAADDAFQETVKQIDVDDVVVVGVVREAEICGTVAGDVHRNIHLLNEIDFVACVSCVGNDHRSVGCCRERHTLSQLMMQTSY